MIVFEELIGTLEKIQRGMPYIVEETAKDDYIQKQFIDLNQEQMYAGKNNDGSPIEPEYAESTKKYKKRRGDPQDRVTLLDKGKFYDDMKNVFSSTGVTLTSTDPKTKRLTKKYGEEIFGLTPDSLDKVREEFFAILRYKVVSRYFPHLL